MDASERQHHRYEVRTVVGLSAGCVALSVNGYGYSYYWRYYSIPTSRRHAPENVQ
jgi:hypothetical protein